MSESEILGSSETTFFKVCFTHTKDIYFLDKGALIIGFADKRPLIQRALYGRCPYPSDGATSKNSLNLSAFAARPHSWPRAKNRIQASVSYHLVCSVTLAGGVIQASMDEGG